MPKQICYACNKSYAALKRPKNDDLMCQECFFTYFESEIHETIIKNNLFQRGDIVASGASGGKDSTVLMHLLKTLNERYDYGIQLVLLSIDEGIAGYRDDSLKTVYRNSVFYDLPLHVLSYKDLYGWTMDEIVREIGMKNNCTFCGVFRRQALDRGAALIGANKVVTGHNADDTAETILMNILRSDGARLARCVNTTTNTANDSGMIPRVKPLKYCYEKEIVLYAHFKKLDYFTTECTYSTEAFRGNARALIKELEKIDPRCIVNIIYSGEHMPPHFGNETMEAKSDKGREAMVEYPILNAKILSNETNYNNINNVESSDQKNSHVNLKIISNDNKDGLTITTEIDNSNNSSFDHSRHRKCVRCGYITSQELCRACILLQALNSGVARLAVKKAGNRLGNEYANVAAREMMQQQKERLSSKKIKTEEKKSMKEKVSEEGGKKVGNE